MDIQSIALAAGLAWASGLRLYVVLFLVGMAGYFGWIALPTHLEVLANPIVLGTTVSETGTFSTLADRWRKMTEVFAEEVNKTGVAMLVVEQNANLALDIADRGYVLEAGTIAIGGAADDLQQDESVRKAYLGY